MHQDRPEHVARLPGEQISRRGAIGRVAGAGVVAALTTTGLSLARNGARASSRTSLSTASSPQGVLMAQATPASGAAPTVVLVHGAFADASGWAGVISRLHAEGIPV